MTDERRPTDRWLLLIAAERALRAVLLLTVGVILLTHLQTDWADLLRRLVARAGLNPNRNSIARVLDAAGALTTHKLVRDGIVAIGYGALEAVEGYGLWRHRRWAEYLTVVSTSLLFIPEIDEMVRRVTALKVVALVVNVLVVGYLVRRLVRTRER